MATRSLGTLTIDLIAKTAGFTQGMDTASRSAKRAGKDIESSLSSSVDKAVRSLRTLAGVAGVGFSVQQIAQYADAFTGLQNRLRLVTDTQEELATATNDLFDISLRTAQSIDSTAQVYQRFAQNADRLGLSLQDIADVTDTVAKAVAISGSSAASAEAALVQFGQAIASGVLRGQELNSVMEQTPGLAMAIADGLGVTIGELRALAADGKITADALITALRRAAEGVDQQFSTRVLTLGQGFENLRTSVTEYVGRLDSAAGASNSLAMAIDNIAQSISEASRNMGDIGREIDAVKELFVVLDDFSQDFLQGFRSDSGDASQYFQTSFADSFLATAKEIDYIAADFQGFFGGVEAAVTALGNNIIAIFSNAWEAVLRGAQDMLNGVIRAYNEVASLVGGPQMAELSISASSASEIQNIFDAYVNGYKEAAVGLGAFDELSHRLEVRRVIRAYQEIEDLDAVSQGHARAGEEAENAGKKKVDEGQRYIENLRRQLETVLKLTEYETLRARMAEGQIKFATKAQEDQALAYAQTIDFIREQEEAYKSLEETNRQASRIFEALLTEEEAIRESYDRRREIILESTIATADEKAEALRRLEEETNEALLEASGSYWERYLAAAEESLTSFDELAGNVVENFSRQFGDAFESMVFDAESLGDAVGGMAEGMARSVINALGQMAAQWLAYQVVQMLVGRTTQAGAAAAMTANATATSLQAGLAAFASTAAIPIVGPVAAPAAMAAALAATSPMVAAISSVSLAGMAHDGIDSVPQTGTWLLEKGERVTTAETSAKLDATLERLNSDMRGNRGNQGTVVNVIEDPSRAGEVETRREDDREIIDVVVADIYGGGRASRALEASYGLRRQGR